MNERAAIYGLLLGLIWPASQLTVHHDRPFAWTAPKSYYLGDAVLIPHLPSLQEVRLSGRRMSFLPKQQMWLGVAPQGQVALTFFWQPDESWARGWLSPDKIEFSEKVIPTQSARLDTAGELRLPASVWKKVNDLQNEQRARDRQTLSQIMNDFSGELETSCWQTPLKSRITSNFGSPRRLPNGHAYFHGGEDRRAAVGTPVMAAGAGQVAFAGEMVVPGVNVVIRHGGGWFTRYLHFSKTAIETGHEVKAGQKIGFSGASGRVEAPHLHWEIVWQGIVADPGRFLQAWARLCDPT
ncbi:MAG: M23 family metallopeptidase [Bdellovibrionales bacterium]